MSEEVKTAVLPASTLRFDSKFSVRYSVAYVFESSLSAIATLLLAVVDLDKSTSSRILSFSLLVAVNPSSVPML